MKITARWTPAGVAVLGLAVAIGSIALAADSNQPEMKLPPGWTMEDMQRCMQAGTPGKQQAMLVKEAGTWHGKSTMWMSPGAEPVASECTSTISPMMDGRFIKVEMAGEMPGMGPYHGFGIYGFDNVSQQYVSMWVDNHSTGIMNGVGEASGDGKTMTWNFTVNCPLAEKPTTLREVDTTTGPNTKTLEMYGSDPKTGKEFKMMEIKFTKK